MIATVTETIAAPSVHYLAVLPELILTGCCVALLIASALVRGRLPRTVGTATTVLGCVAVAVVCAIQWRTVAIHGASTTIAHAVVLDGFAVIATGIVAISLGLSALVCDGWLAREGIDGVELHILALASAAGAVLMVQANDLVVIFVGLEILSISLYVLAAFNRRSSRSGEAAMKYFLLGGFSSAIFVYGIALVYGATGTTQLTEMAAFLAHNVLKSDGLMLAGVALLIVGFAFKVAAVPFHAWSPDVYEGAPTPITGLMASIVKVGAFAAVLRVLASALFTQQAGWRPIIWALAALSMVLGAGWAVVQRNVKRLLAYSSVSHAGFILVGLWATSTRGTAACLYYLMAYSLLVVGSFAVVTVVTAGGTEDLTAFRGLAHRRPLLAGAFTVLLLAQAGVPFTTGFLAKLAVIEAAVSHAGAPGVTLGVIAMLATAIGAYFYLRLVVLCYATPLDAAPAAAATDAQLRSTARLAAVGAGVLVDDDRDGPPAARDDDGAPVAPGAADAAGRVPAATGVAVALCVVPTVVFGIWASPLADLAQHAQFLYHP